MNKLYLALSYTTYDDKEAGLRSLLFSWINSQFPSLRLY